MGSHLATTPNPVSSPPPNSPIEKFKTLDFLLASENERLAKAESNLFRSLDHRVSITSHVTHGDAIMSIAGSIKTEEELEVIARYLVRFVDLPGAVEINVALAVLKQLRNSLRDALDGSGGVDYIVQKNVERTFLPKDDTQFTPLTQEENNFIDECLVTMDQMKAVDQAIKYLSKLAKKF
jgi:hypothetical protein